MDMNAIYREMELKDKKEKIEKYKILNQYVNKGEILFVGSSLMEAFPIHELSMDCDLHRKIYNRGISGYTTTELIEALDTCILELEPSKIFINIGSNDIASETYTAEDLLKNYAYILDVIKEKLPQTKVYMMAYYPVNELDDFEGKSDKGWFTLRNNENITIANHKIQALAEQYNYQFINLNKGLFDERGQLKKGYTMDGIHMYANGYKKVFDQILTYILSND